MTDDHELVRFEIPADFVLARALPTGAELAYGFRHGWLRRADVVTLALARYEAGSRLSQPEEQLALLLSDELDRVDDLVAELEISDEPAEQRAALWLFLALAWLLDHRESFDDPHAVIEMLYADFGYPQEIQGLVRYMPPVTGPSPSPQAIDDHWRRYVERRTAEYRSRDDLPSPSER